MQIDLCRHNGMAPTTDCSLGIVHNIPCVWAALADKEIED
jgi:hypothetical protein